MQRNVLYILKHVFYLQANAAEAVYVLWPSEILIFSSLAPIANIMVHKFCERLTVSYKQCNDDKWLPNE